MIFKTYNLVVEEHPYGSICLTSFDCMGFELCVTHLEKKEVQDLVTSLSQWLQDQEQ